MFQKNEILFSVITVVFNGEDVIEKTAESIIKQTFKGFEYIVVDGASHDQTLTKLEKYSSHISKIISEPDNGIYDAMNKGISLAKGQFVVFMNAGDVFYCEDVLLKVSRSEINFFDVLYGNTFVSIPVLEKNKLLYVIPKRLEYLWRGFGYCGISHQSLFVRTEYARLFPFSMRYNISSDFFQVFSLYVSGSKFFYLPFPVALVQQDGISSQQFFYSKIQDFLIVSHVKDFPMKARHYGYYLISIVYKCNVMLLKSLLSRRFFSRLKNAKDFVLNRSYDNI